MKTTELKKKFIGFFAEHNHNILPSASLIPIQDPSLLFINAGMTPLKGWFCNPNSSPYKQVASVQKCLRAGGKHNDLNNVGLTGRHHTFFEMAGNFSFGGYDKHTSMTLAYKFLTEVLTLDPQRLYISYLPENKNVLSSWQDITQLPKEHFFTDEENIWAIGDTGPFGSCTEIYYKKADGELLEIWNIVFIESNKLPDGTIKTLEVPCIDTGIGVERLSALLQGVENNYANDVFTYLKSSIEGYKQLPADALNIMADHIRATAFLIADGLLPSNQGRGYVLRRIMRRAFNCYQRYNIRAGTFARFLPPLIEIMGNDYPELISNFDNIQQHILIEEEKFLALVDLNKSLIESIIDKSITNNRTLSGSDAFYLYDTKGIPIDLIIGLCNQHNLTFNEEEFESCMHKQKELATQSSAFVSSSLPSELCTEFVGYETLNYSSDILALYNYDLTDPISQLNTNQAGAIILAHTPFFAEAGGQVGDKGIIYNQNQSAKFEVENTIYSGNVIVHLGKLVQGSLQVNDNVQSQVDPLYREQVTCNHTATHLFCAVIRDCLGSTAEIHSTSVDAEKFRIDINTPTKLTMADIYLLEQKVNKWIRGNFICHIEHHALTEAKKLGAHTLPNYQYDAQVRILKVEGIDRPISIEACCGTHVNNLGRIGQVKVLSLRSIAQGIKRIEVTSGDNAAQLASAQGQTLQELSQDLNINWQQLPNKLHSLINQLKDTQNKLSELNKQLLAYELKQAEYHHIGIYEVVYCYLKSELSRDIVMKACLTYSQKKDRLCIFAVDAGIHISTHDAELLKLAVNILKTSFHASGGGVGKNYGYLQVSNFNIAELLEELDSWLISHKKDY